MRRNAFVIVALVFVTMGIGDCALAQEPVEVHVLALFSLDVMESLVAAEFCIENIPRDYCIVTEDWASDLIIGNIDYGFAIAFPQPQPGPIVYLGTLGFLAFSDVGQDEILWVMPSNSSGKLVVVDELYNEIDTAGWIHIFNCDEFCGFCEGQWDLRGGSARDPHYPTIGLFADLEGQDCDQDLPVIPTPVEGSSWGSLKALYR